MTIAVLDFNNGEVDIIENCPNLQTTEEVEGYLTEVFKYNIDEINYMFSSAIDVNSLTPDDYSSEEDAVERYRLVAETHSQHKAYVDRNGYEPTMADVRIKYHEDGIEMDTTISLVKEEVGFDEDIFFTCDGIDELIRLCYADTEDFDVIEVY